MQFEIDGARSEMTVEMAGPKFELKDHRIPLERSHERGWGRVSIPADANPADNDYWFVFDEPAPRRAIVVADDPQAARPLQLAAAISPDPAVKCSAEVGRGRQAGRRGVGEVALLLWQAPLPEGRRGEAGPGVHRPRRPGDLLPAAQPRTRASSSASAGPTGSNRPRRVPVENWRGDQDLLAQHPERRGAARRPACRSGEYCGLSGEFTRWPRSAAAPRCWRG